MWKYEFPTYLSPTYIIIFIKFILFYIFGIYQYNIIISIFFYAFSSAPTSRVGDF